MHFLDLDLDVVHTIISHVDQKDMLQLATTCTSLYEPVMCQRLARLDTGNFTKRANLRKYFGYMLRDACRPQYLSSVALSSWPRAYEDADDDCGTEQFAQIIRQATRLTTLKCCPGNTECSAKPFLDAITSVKTLTSLELGLHDEDMLHVVSTLQSDPYRLLCWFLSPRDGAEPRVPVPHFFSKFVASSHLRQLELVNAPPSLFETGECDAVATLPSVRELIISQPVPSNLHLAPRIFPNVETLYLTHLTKKDQPQVPFAWPSVDYLSTDFEVAITGPVHHVSILAMSPCAQSYSDMLHRLRPSILECYLDQMYMQAVARLPQPMPFLHLRLVATLNESLQQYLYDYLVIIKGVPLVGLALMLPASLKRDVDDFAAIRAMCAWIADTVPLLEYVGLVWFQYSHKDSRVVDSSSWFKVTARSEQDGPSLVALSEKEGSALYAGLPNTAT